MSHIHDPHEIFTVPSASTQTRTRLQTQQKVFNGTGNPTVELFRKNACRAGDNRYDDDDDDDVDHADGTEEACARPPNGGSISLFVFCKQSY